MGNNNFKNTLLTVFLSMVFTLMAVTIIGLVLDRQKLSKTEPIKTETLPAQAQPIEVAPVVQPMTQPIVPPVQPVYQVPAPQPQVHYPVQHRTNATLQPIKPAPNQPTIAQIRAGRDKEKLDAVMQTGPTTNTAEIVEQNPGNNALNFGKPRKECHQPCYQCHQR